LAAWLSKARIEKGWSVPELAFHSEVTAPAIYRIEAAITRNLRETTRKKLEHALSTKVPEYTANEVAAEAEVVGLGALEDFDPHIDIEVQFLHAHSKQTLKDVVNLLRAASIPCAAIADIDLLNSRSDIIGLLESFGRSPAPDE